MDLKETYFLSLVLSESSGEEKNSEFCLHWYKVQCELNSYVINLLTSQWQRCRLELAIGHMFCKLLLLTLCVLVLP